MTDILNYLFSSSAWWIWLLLAVVIAAGIYIRHDSFVLTDLTYRFPVIGKLSRYSRDYSETNRGGWLNAEASLCHDYARHVTALSPTDFERNSEYLRHAYDHGRKPMPLRILCLIVILVVMEGVGFAYMLGSWMALESTQSERLALTAAIVIVLAAILVWVTHSAGHQLYRTRLLRGCFQQYQASAIQSDTKDRPKVFSSEIVALSSDQSVDAAYPPHVRCANRVITRPDDLGSFAWVWLASILVVTIAVMSTILRMETLHGTDLLTSQLAGGFEGGDPEAQRAAQETAALTSFAILAVIFIVTQMVGMGVGYWYGFAGKQSPQAYHAITGAADYETYFGPIRRRMSIADLRLTTLHRLMEKRLPHEIQWERDFYEFIRDERARGATDLQDPVELAYASGAVRREPEDRPHGANGARLPAAENDPRVAIVQIPTDGAPPAEGGPQL